MPRFFHIQAYIIVLSLSMLMIACKKDYQVVSGRVSVAGNTPFTYVRVIDQDNVEYKIVGPKVEILRKSFQGRIVQLEGKVVKEAIGPGFPAEFLVLKIIE